jgi:hypothetical protein
MVFFVGFQEDNAKVVPLKRLWKRLDSLGFKPVIEVRGEGKTPRRAVASNVILYSWKIAWLGDRRRMATATVVP